MSEYSLDGLVNQFAVVLNAMTESESLLRDRIRSVRLDAQRHPSHVVAPSAPGACSSAVGDVRRGERSASDHQSHSTDAAPTWTTSDSRPEFSEPSEFQQSDPSGPTTGHRNYDYFSELDEKLTGLRQRYLE